MIKDIKTKFISSILANRLGHLYWGTKHLINYGTHDFFRNINIEINTSCNRRCSYCPNSVYDRGLIKNAKYLETEYYKKIIDELADLGFNGEVCPVHYGEPLLDKRILDLIRYTRIKLPKSKIKLFSNADLLDKEKYKSLVDAGMSEIVITQHEGNSIRKIQEILDYHNKYCKNECKLIYKKFDEETPLLNRGGDVKPNKIIYNPSCVYTSNPLVVNYNGDIVLCCNDFLGIYTFGNIKDKKLIDIWKSKKYKEMRKRLKRRQFILSICKKCVGIENEKN